MKTVTVGPAFECGLYWTKSVRPEIRIRAQPGIAQVYRAGQEALR
jgi:hypothetical protein